MDRRDQEVLEITLLESLKKLLDKTIKYSHKENILFEEEVDTYIEENINSRKCIYSILSEVLRERTPDETSLLIDKINVRVASFETNRIKNFLLNSEFSIFRSDIDKFISSIENKFNQVEKVLEVPKTESTIIIETTSVVIPDNEEDSEGRTTRLLKIIDDRIETLEKEASKNEETVEINFFKKEEPSLEQPNEEDIDNLFSPIKEEKIEETKEIIDVDNSLIDEVNEVLETTEEKIEEKQDAFELSKEISESVNSKLSKEEIDGFIKKIDDKLAELEKEEKALDFSRFNPFNKER